MPEAFEGEAFEGQVGGDCQQLRCAGGELFSQSDDNDVPDDENPCTVDGCEEGVPVHTPLTDGYPCGTNGACIRGECL
jgi:hypothetical protein